MKVPYVVLLMLLFVVDGFALGKSSFFSSWFRKKRDCEWSHWQGAKCEFAGNHTLQIRQTRYKIEARNGGNDCVGSTTERDIDCNNVQYTAHALLNAIAIATDVEQNTKSSQCATPLFGADGTLIVGGKCDKSRRKRRMVGTYEQTAIESEKIQNLRIKRSTIKSKRNRDVLFLIDESGSVGNENMKKLKRLAKSLLSKFCGSIEVGKQKTRVGIMTFDDSQKVHLNFDSLFSKSQIFSVFDNIRPSHGGTCIYEALNFVKNDMMTSARGARVVVKETERLVIFMTDGCSACGRTSAESTALLRGMRQTLENENIGILSYFVGQDNSCTDSILELSTGSRCHEYFRARSWEEVDQMSDELDAEPTCIDAWVMGTPCS